MKDFDELVKVARDEPPYTLSEECGTCGAEIGANCTVDCDTCGEKAVQAVRKLLDPLDGEEFAKMLRAAREREARDGETPGFFWAWEAVNDEADERGVDVPPVGI